MGLEAAYIPVKDEQDKEIPYMDDSESELLPRSSSSDIEWRTRSYAERHWNSLAIHALFGVLNVAFLIGAAYLYYKSLSQRPGFLYCELSKSAPILQHKWLTKAKHLPKGLLSTRLGLSILLFLPKTDTTAILPRSRVTLGRS